MYTVTTDGNSQSQIEALPARALTYFAELRATLEVAPWSGVPYSALKPDGLMRAYWFGPDSEGYAVYLILEDQRRADLVEVLWLD